MKKHIWFIIIISIILVSCSKKNNTQELQAIEKNVSNNELLEVDKDKSSSDINTINRNNIQSINEIEETVDDKPFIEDYGQILSIENTNLRFHKYYEPDVFGETTEIVFTNNISGNKIYYSGINGLGEGVYWVLDGTEKVELFNKNVRQDAMVNWYGEDIVAIFDHGNITVRVIAYYDFKFKTVTFVSDPEYVDIERHLVVNTYDVYEGGREINIIDLGKSRIIKNINFFEDTDYKPTTAIGFDFELTDNEIIISYHFAFTGVEGVKVYNYSR